MVDLCGPPKTGGTGIKQLRLVGDPLTFQLGWKSSHFSIGLEVLSLFNFKLKTLRENIAESKLSYEIMDDAGDKQISKINKIDKIGTRSDERFRINLSFSSNFPEGQDPRQHHKILHAHCLQRLYWVGGPFYSKDGRGGDDNLRPNQK